MTGTFLAYDYLAGIRNAQQDIPLPCGASFAGANRAAAFDTDPLGLYIRPAAIIKSSVGEFYDQNMKFFFDTVKLLRPIVADHLLKKEGTVEDLDHILCHLLPLGTTALEPVFGISGIEQLATYGLSKVGMSDPYIASGIAHPLEEVRNLLACYRSSQADYIKAKMERVERVAHGLCAGYTPQKTDAVTRLPNDSGYLSEYIMANILYPWVMQPMRQLRLLTPSLDDDFITAITQGYVGYEKQSVHFPPGLGLDAGYSISYDFLSDFITYGHFRNVHPVFSCLFQRQFWTPFFGFSIPAVLTELEDEKLKAQVMECAARSKKLYMEMLKTGLRYESQYALLCGYIGRFNLAGNLAGIYEYIQTLRPLGIRHAGGTVADLLGVVEANLKETVPFVNSSGLLNLT